MHVNEIIIKTFCEQFEPPLAYALTLRINGVALPNAYQATYWDQAKGVGLTCVVYEGQIHAYTEAAGRGDIAAKAGQVLAAAMGLSKPSEAA